MTNRFILIAIGTCVLTLVVVFATMASKECRDGVPYLGSCRTTEHILVVEEGTPVCRCKKETP